MVIIPLLIVIVGSLGVFLRKLAAVLPGAGFLLSWVLPLVLTSAIFFLIYWLTPNTRVRVLPALAAGVVAGIGFQLLQDLFVLMQQSIFRYNRIYGSFAALPLFLIWLRWSWEIALFGAELGFVMQHIGSGMFDFPARVSGSSRRSRRFRQLAVARRIYVKFYAGGGASSFDELSGDLAMPEVFLERDLVALTAAGVICRVEDDGSEDSYVPLLPASLTVAGCVKQLDESGEDEVPSDVRKAEAALTATEENLYRAMLSSPDDLPLVEVGGTAEHTA